MAVNNSYFDTTADGREVTRTILENSTGMRVSLLNYGCVVQSIQVPDREGRPIEVCLGYDNIAQYERDTFFLGAVVGRNANRIGGAAFDLNGTHYELECNNAPNHLHGGSDGFHTRIYDVQSTENSVTYSRVSPDGESGYPGNLAVSVRYTLTENNALEIEYSATSDADTLLNLTNHSYFNLAGAGNGDILDTVLCIRASQYTEIDTNGLPTGVVSPVVGTPFDFISPKPIGRDIEAYDAQLGCGQGYDHNFVLDGGGNFAAEARSPRSGIVLRVFTTKPGVQLYTGNFMTSEEIIGGRCVWRGGFCLETQFFPDGIHHENFASPILRAGQRYNYRTVFTFSCE